MLRRSINDPEVQEFLGSTIDKVARDEYYGSIEFKSDGVEIVFKEAPWVIPIEKIDDKTELFISAFHFHRSGHDNYSGYLGKMQNGVALGDSDTTIELKLGLPAAVGGGSMSSVLKRMVPRWLQYPVGEAIVNFQLDSNNKSELATLYAPDQKI
jgi:hypothetical protein